MATAPPLQTTEARAFGTRVWLACLATQELFSMYLGVRLGLYQLLAAKGPCTVPSLAAQAGLAPRYAREWLEQQAVAGILVVDDPALPADSRAYTLPAGHAEVLLPSDSPVSVAATAVLPLGGVARALPLLIEAYRTGDGVADAEFGEDWRQGHSGANRALFTHVLPGWVRGLLPAVHARLSSGGRVADVACGTGWASISLALAYPKARFHGLDLDADAVIEARRNAGDVGVADRVTFEVRDATDPPDSARFDLVCLFDALHELGRPVEALRACRVLRAPGGSVLVMDARVANAFSAPGDEVERFQYGTSLLHCLPAALAGPSAAGTGTVLRSGIVRDLAAEAGFSAVEVLPARERFHRLYHLIG